AACAPSARKSRSRVTMILGRPGSGFFGSESQVLRPITMGLFMVTRLNHAMSPESRQGIALSRPITPFAATATMSDMTGIPSDRHGRGDMRMRFVAFEAEIVIGEVEDRLHIGIDVHARQRARFARELQIRLLQMIEIEMRVAEGMDELPRLQSRR